MGHGDYFRHRFSRAMVKSIILVAILALLSVANKTILFEPQIKLGHVYQVWHFDSDGRMYFAVKFAFCEIFAVYLGIQYIVATIDVLYFYVFRGGWKSEFPRGAELEPLDLEAISEQFGKLQEDFLKLELDFASLKEECR